MIAETINSIAFLLIAPWVFASFLAGALSYRTYSKIKENHNYD